MNTEIEIEIEIDTKNKRVKVWKNDALLGFATMRVVKEFPRSSKAPASKYLYEYSETSDRCHFTEKGECLKTIFRCHNAAIALNTRAGREVARIGRGEYPVIYVLKDSL